MYTTKKPLTNGFFSEVANKVYDFAKKILHRKCGYARDYGTERAFGNFSTGWMLPSTLSLFEIGKERETLNKTLTALNGTDTTLVGKTYWSSVSRKGAGDCFTAITLQLINEEKVGQLYGLNLNYGNYDNKTLEKNVIAVRAFQF